MRQIRLEENFDEAVLPETIQSIPDICKGSSKMESLKLTPENKHDQTNTRFESNYREDGALN